VSWSGITEAATTWTGFSDAATAWTRASGSNTTGRNSSRFIRLDGASDGTGGVDFLYRVVALGDPHLFYIEDAVPISLRSTNENPA
jgi:hypothetical protein